MTSSADSNPHVDLGPRPDAELIAGMRLSDGEALGSLFRRYARLVHRVAVDILRDKGEAEDVTQEVFMELYRKAHLYDPARGSVRVWLLQYAYHRSLRRKASLRCRAAYGAEPLDAIEEQADGDGRRLTREECRWVIRTGLAQLPERQRATLELACFEELSLRDVAARLGVSVGCTRHYYYRGLARLRAWARLAAARPPCSEPAAPADFGVRARDQPPRGVRRSNRPPCERPGTERRGASEVDTAGVETDQDPRLCARI
jgi:RNA polymerase sigma-70 factor (ECF subfamily)